MKTRRITTVQLLAAWLLFLALFDAVAIARLLKEPLASVSPIFLPSAAAAAGAAAAADANGAGSFRALFRAFLALLVFVRLNAAFDIRNLTAWRITAIVHVVEAAYFTQAAFLSAEGVFGPRGPRKPPATAVLVFASIVLNAVIFTGWWAWLRVRERRELAAAAGGAGAGGAGAGTGAGNGGAAAGAGAVGGGAVGGGGGGGNSTGNSVKFADGSAAPATEQPARQLAAAAARAQAQAQADANLHLESEDEEAHEEEREADDSDNAEDDETDEDFDPAAGTAPDGGAGAARTAAPSGAAADGIRKR